MRLQSRYLLAKFLANNFMFLDPRIFDMTSQRCYVMQPNQKFRKPEHIRISVIPSGNSWKLVNGFNSVHFYQLGVRRGFELKFQESLVHYGNGWSRIKLPVQEISVKFVIKREEKPVDKFAREHKKIVLWYGQDKHFLDILFQLWNENMRF